jgi:hypothetical protein
MININNSLDYKKRTIIIVFCIFTAVLLAVSCMPAALAEKDYMQPGYVFGTNYYNSYGEPDLYASMLGDFEFERGETARIKIDLVNKGVLYGFKYDTTVGTENDKHALSLKELEYETRRTTALGIKAELVSTSPYIEVEPETSIQTMEELIPGELPEDKLVYSITISNEAPAGVYYLQLLTSYEYQSQVRMAKNEVTRLGLIGIDHITSYTSANKTLTIPISIKASPRFTVVDVSGHLVTGQSAAITVKYQNLGETAAQDANVRMVAMRPLSIRQSVVYLGTIKPGESKTASIEVFSSRDTVIKTYGVDSEIKYFNDDGKIEFSDNLKVSIPLQEAPKKIGIFMLAVMGLFIVIIFMIIIMIIGSIRNKNKKD